MIQQVRAQFNGQWVTLTYDQSKLAWVGTITPQDTSFTQPGHYFNISVEAANDNGLSASEDGTTNEALRLIVNEQVPPTLTIVSPQPGDVNTGQPQIVFYAEDEEGGSGTDITTLVVKADGVTAASTSISWQTIPRGYQVTYTPNPSLADGQHTIEVTVSDFDGNTAQMELPYWVDTQAPALNLNEPRYRSVVDTPYIFIDGNATDASTLVTVSLTVNGELYASAYVFPPQGYFLWNAPLKVGKNIIKVTAADRVGWETSKEFVIFRLITDRTQEDVDAVTGLIRKPYSQWTAEEKEKFPDAVSRGSYNNTDMNRVTLAASHLADKFIGYGYNPNFEPVYPAQGRTEWRETDWPTSSLTNAYLANIERLRDMMSIQLPLPEDMSAFTYEQANQIERVLVELDTYAPMLNNAFYAGEIYAGEV